MDMKKCSKCQTIQPLDNFYRNGKYVVSPCKQCRHVWKLSYHKKNRESLLAKNRIYYQRNQERIRAKRLEPKFLEAEKNRNLQWHYGITLEQKRQKWVDQNGKCANSGCQEKLDKNGAHIDHDHKTGKIRGLLCRSCNLTIGNAKENVVRLRGLITYLQKYTLPATI